MKPTIKTNSIRRRFKRLEECFHMSFYLDEISRARCVEKCFSLEFFLNIFRTPNNCVRCL